MRIEETELIPVFIDVESYVDDEVTLKKMTLRKYLAATYMTALAVAVGRSDVEVIDFDEGEPDEYGVQVINELKRLALDPKYVFVAHNAAFDIRVLRFLLGIPQPCNVWCTLEGAMGAWPDLPHGYGLFNCSMKLKLSKRKFDLTLNDLGRLRAQAVKKQNGVPWIHVKEELREQIKVILAAVDKQVPVYVREEDVDEILRVYNKRDVEVMQELYYREVEILPDVEKRVALMTHRVRRNHFNINNERLEGLVEQLRDAATVAESTASKLLHAELDDETAATALKDIFNDTSGATESIRYLRLRKVINDKMGAPELKSTSLKKLNPVMLAPHQNVAGLLEQTSRVSKMIFHRRRAQVFRDMDEVDVELGYMRAITGRFSSPSSGAGGLNLHNCPKHDKAVAKPVRQLFRVPDDMCLVRGDLANVEYRCILQGTPVLTVEGYKKIEDITAKDLVWDGMEYVACKGAVCRGHQEVIEVHGVWMTRDHPVLTGTGWREAEAVVTLPFLPVGCDSGDGLVRGNSPKTTTVGIESQSNATVETSAVSRTPTSCGELAENAEAVLPSVDGENDKLSKTRNCGLNGYSVISGYSQDATSRTPTTGSIMGVGASLSQQSSKPEMTSCGTLSRCQSGTTQADPLTESTTMGATASEICDARLEQSRMPTNGFQTGLVYDILDCGPRNRFVVGDLVVHNCEGRLTGCKTIVKMFESNVLADPYCEAWKAMTGQSITKAMPIRQVSKAAVLGLGFLMSPTGYAKVLLKAISTNDVSYEMLRDIAEQLAWMDPGKPVDTVINKVGCERIVALAAYHIHRSFNSAHPEFNILGEWLLRCASVVANTHVHGTGSFDQAQKLIDQMRDSSSAPDPSMIYVDIDKDRTFEFPSIKINCGPWVPTLCWREPQMARSIFEQHLSEYRLCIRKSNGTMKPFTKQLAIENVTQAAARNALCDGLIKLEKMGYMDILHVHDEIMLLVRKERNAVLKARDDLLKVFGPDATGKPMGWAVLIKPEEVSITQSLYEDEDDLAVTIKNKKTGEIRPGGDRWGKIERNELLCLDNLP